MPTFVAGNRDRVWSIGATTPPEVAKLPRQNDSFNISGPHTRRSKLEHTRDRSDSSRNLLFGSPSKTTPSLCGDTLPSPSTTPSSSASRVRSSNFAIFRNLFSSSDEIQKSEFLTTRQLKSPVGARIPHRGDKAQTAIRPSIERESEVHLRSGFQTDDPNDCIFRWLSDTTGDGSNDIAQVQMKIKSPTIYSDKLTEYEAKDIFGCVDPIYSSVRKSEDSSNAVTQDLGSEADTSVNDFSVAVTTQSMIEFHHQTVRQLLQEFREWEKCRKHDPSTDADGSGASSSVSEPAKVDGIPQSYGPLTVHRGQYAAGQKRGPDDDQDEKPPPRKRNKNQGLVEGRSPTTLACPFAVKNPLKYQKCFGYRLCDTSRVKQHLNREHLVPSHCSRCSKVFSNPEERVEHQRQDPPCPNLPPTIWDGVNEAQQKNLKKKLSAKKTEVEKWNHIYTILFPESPLPESPFFDDLDVSDNMSIMRQWFHQQTSSFVQRHMQTMPAALRDDEPQMTQFFNSVFHDMLDSYAEHCSPTASSVAHTPRTQGGRFVYLNTPSSGTDSTLATTLSSSSTHIYRDCSSPSPHPFSGHLTSSQEFQAVMGITGWNDESYNNVQIRNIAPPRINEVPLVTISTPIIGENQLGISLSQVMDPNITLDDPFWISLDRHNDLGSSCN